jgi:hypothetical protein
MADAQVPWGIDAFDSTITQRSWQGKRSWFLLTTADRMIPPKAPPAISKRAGSTVVDVNAKPLRLRLATRTRRRRHQAGRNGRHVKQSLSVRYPHHGAARQSSATTSVRRGGQVRRSAGRGPGEGAPLVCSGGNGCADELKQRVVHLLGVCPGDRMWAAFDHDEHTVVDEIG